MRITMAFRLIVMRYWQEIEWSHESMDSALRQAWGDLNWNKAYPVDLYNDDVILYTNRGGHPLVEGTTPLLDAINAWAKQNGLE